MILTYNPELYEDFERIYTALILGYGAYTLGRIGMKIIPSLVDSLVDRKINHDLERSVNEYKRKWKEEL